MFRYLGFALRALLLLPIPLLWIWLEQEQFGGEGEERTYFGEHGRLTGMEERMLDLLFRYRGELRSPVRIVYVDIDSYSIDRLSNFPWDRGWYALVCEALLELGGVRAIGIDVLQSEDGQALLTRELFTPGNAAFASLLRRDDRIVLPASYSSAIFVRPDGTVGFRPMPLGPLGFPPASQIELPEMSELVLHWGPDGNNVSFSPPSLGLIDALDNDTRWVPLHTPPPEGYEPFLHLALMLYLKQAGLGRDAVHIHDDRIEIVDPAGTASRTIPLIHRQLLQVNWFQRWDSAQSERMSFATVLDYASLLADSEASESEHIAAAEFFRQFQDAIVLIGPVDPLLQDIARTPIDPRPVPKVSVHANVLRTIAASAYIQVLPPWAEIAIVLVLSGLVTAMVTLSVNHVWALRVAAGFVVAVFLYVALEAFRLYNLHIPIVSTLGATFSTSFLAAAVQLVSEQRQKGRIKAMFGTYVSPELVRRMVESQDAPRLGGAEVRITAYFSDIQSFSSFSEKLPPADLVVLMNEYLSSCTDILTEENGTLDKYIGDAVVAMFGAPVEVPDHAVRACRTALRVHERQRELGRRWAQDPRWPVIVHNMRTRIGLNTGLAVVGNIGSTTRFNYTMMGDTVNIAARLESGGKQYGVGTLVTGETRAAARQGVGDAFTFRFLDRIEVVGRSEPLEVYELFAFTEKLDDLDKRCLDLFAEGRAKLDARDFQGAIGLFEAASARERSIPGRDYAVKTNPSLVFLKRCRLFLEKPPSEDWDGVHRMTEK